MVAGALMVSSKASGDEGRFSPGHKTGLNGGSWSSRVACWTCKVGDQQENPLPCLSVPRPVQTVRSSKPEKSASSPHTRHSSPPRHSLARSFSPKVGPRGVAVCEELLILAGPVPEPPAPCRGWSVGGVCTWGGWRRRSGQGEKARDVSG